MKDGNWRPLSKYLVKYLPKHRPYTKLEAAFCLQCDYDDRNAITISGYSALWQWSRKKVNLFLSQMGIEIIYPENTQKKQNQKGQIRVQIRDRSGTDKEQIRLIDFSELQTEKNRQGTDKGQIRDRYGSTTIEPNPKPEPKKTFMSDSPEYRLANYLYRLILNRNGKFKKPNLQNWSNSIDLMLRIDKRSPDDVQAVIKWCQNDTAENQTTGKWKGWANNILSVNNLRKKFDTLFARMNDSGIEPTPTILEPTNYQPSIEEVLS